ncbi:hypothetical protein AGMMS50249_5860 [candidate division SR1 bacterium]|nr:hypothetical protein AGMMS50249_5860 [candidate division SR1 bacterium]
MKSKLANRIGLILMGIFTVAMLFFGRESISAFLANHTYYKDMVSSGSGRGLVISAVIIAVIPVLYLLYSSKFTLKKWLIILGSSITFFGLIHSIIKGDVYGFGRFIILFHTAFLMLLGIYTVIGCFSLGSFIESKFLKFSQHRRQELFLTFGIGLCAFLAIIQILVGADLLFGVVSRVLFIGLGVLTYLRRKTISSYSQVLTHILSSLHSQIKTNKTLIISISVLLTISIMYLLFGYQNSFIPYSTARDANHEYMYTPKILAENNGVYRGNTIGSIMPGMWHMWITFFFSLSGLTGGLFGLSSDTIAVSTNFTSALLILLFGIGIVFQLVQFLSSKNTGQTEDEEKKEKVKKSGLSVLGITIGRSTLLFWLTSGMGAFLVMVDNKTDLGVMALSSLAILSGLIFLSILDQKDASKKEIRKYLILAGVFFAFACLAKSTAFVDILLFAVFLAGLWISPRCSLGLGLAATGCLRYLNILTSSVMISTTQANYLILLGAICIIGGLVIAILKKKKILIAVKYLIGIMISFLITLILFKTPRQIVNQSYSDTISPKSLIKGLLAQAEPNTQSTDATTSLLEQSSIDQTALAVQPSSSRIDSQLSADECIQQGNIRTPEELAENLKEPPQGGNGGEDLGRYIGYGWRETPRADATFIARLLFPARNICYSLDQTARLLCSNDIQTQSVSNFKIIELKAIYSQITDKDSQGALLLADAIDSFDRNTGSDSANYNIKEYSDHITNLRQFYQSYAIASTSTYIAIPYRYLVPLNITFNWSLQNLSSYYTDIGFTRVLIFIILAVSLVYSIVSTYVSATKGEHTEKYRLSNNLMILSLTTIVGRGIWRVIGSAILWYGTVLISRTMMTLIAFIISLGGSEVNKDKKLTILTYVFFFTVIIAIFIQLFLNFFRIASQGASGPFVRYKASQGIQQIITDDVQNKQEVKTISAKDIFDLQFPQYNPIITALQDRADTDGVVIGGTYISYFLPNQKNLQSDGMGDQMRKKASDNDYCKTYWRLKHDNVKYYVMDPNIASIGMGEGNETILRKFFAKLDPVTGKIDTDGAMTALVRLYELGYLKLISTNNIGTYYAFTLSDDEMKQFFDVQTPEDIVLTRAKLSVMRYFSEDVNTLFSQMGNVFVSKISAGGGLAEIANMYGQEYRIDELKSAAAGLLSKDISGVKNLTQQERFVLVQWYNLYTLLKSSNSDQKSQGQSMLSNILSNGISGSSQIMAFEII